MITSLAYLGLTSSKVKEWADFATGILGCELSDPNTEEVARLRVDDHLWRIQVTRSVDDAVDFIGWNVRSEESLDELAASLPAFGVYPERGDKALARARGVDQLVWFEDPWGTRHELVVGHSVLPGTFRPGRPMSGFVTGAQGLGHVVLIVPDLPAAQHFFTKALGFRLSDKVRHEGDRTSLFFNSGNRHHTLALSAGSGIVGMHHLMLEVNNLDDVGSAQDLCLDRGVPVRKVIGRHTNDRMISFYPTSPSGLHIEYGYGGLSVDEEWEPKTYHAPSIWGHRVPDGASPGLGLIRTFEGQA